VAHALATIGNARFGKAYDPERAATLAMLHDAGEIITGDMPTPVKYYSETIREAYKEVETVAEQRLLSRLPEDLRPVYRDIFGQGQSSGEAWPEEKEKEDYLRRLVKAADKLSALIKCIEEENAGNTEFRTAKRTILAAVDRLCEELPEVRDFRDECLPPYGHTLDELS
jgi:5'-deoxynucleotidase